MGAVPDITASEVQAEAERLALAHGVELELYKSAGVKLVELARISVPEERRGDEIGTQAMNDLLRWADRRGITLWLQVENEARARLTRWYRRLGFVPNRGATKDFGLSMYAQLYRRPRRASGAHAESLPAQVAQSDWRQLLTRPHYISKYVMDEMPEIVDRALRAGAVPPLTYKGAGHSAVVFCDAAGSGWKVGRPGTLLQAWHPDLVVIERDCIEGDVGTPLQDAMLLNLHNEIGRRMAREEWSSVEFKEDSYVLRNGHPILVDASSPVRLGRRQLEYVEDVLDGRRPRDPYDTDSSLAWTLRVEVQHKRLAPEEAAAALRRLGSDKNGPEAAVTQVRGVVS